MLSNTDLGRKLDEIYKTHGAQAAMHKFMALAGHNMPPKDGPLPPPRCRRHLAAT
jgi:hypothetical protein